jgi:hypothetical protein
MQSYDIYELMIIPPNKKGEMIVRELEKPEPNLNLKLKMQLNLF